MTSENIFRIKLAIICSIFLIQTSCRKLVEVEAPSTNINGGNVYNSDATAAAVLTGIYTRMGLDGIRAGMTRITLLGGLSSDELILGKPDVDLLTYYLNNLKADASTGLMWADNYNRIFICNSAIEGLTGSTHLTPKVKKQLLGEAKFIRAFCYFYLVNEFGDIPLTTVVDYRVNSLLSRSPKEEVYKLIVNDLKDAQLLLSDGYVEGDGVNPTLERVRPNKWVATSLLARAYLYLGDYLNAELLSSSVIEQNTLYSIVNLNEVFLKNSRETIWQLQSVIDSYNTTEGYFFIPQYSGGVVFIPAVLLSSQLLNSFENNDDRKTQWINKFTNEGKDYFYPYKYKNAEPGAQVTEYSMVLRLAEQYLIRAEARIRMGDISGGIADLNILRNRASNQNQLMPLPSALSSKDAIIAVQHERQVELFTEWGHRWFDLKRLDMANDILGQIKGSTWQATDQLYPIPQDNIDANPNLKGHQNPGYQ